MPQPFSVKTREQYEALTCGVGVADMGDRTWIEICGADRAGFLHNMCTNEIKQLQSGEGCEAFLTNVQGKILGHVLIFCGPTSLTIETVRGQAEGILSQLDRYIIREDVQLHDRSHQWGELLVAGREAADCLSKIISMTIPTRNLAHISVQIEGIPALLCRVEVAGSDSFLISCLAADRQVVQRVLQQQGARVCDDQVVEMVRIEAGWPWYGVDISDNNLPQEVDRNQRAISFTKGCYLGQETVARIDALGHVNRTLRGVLFSGSAEVPTAGMELTHGDRAMGTVTSTAFSPRLGAPLAWACVRRESHEPGTELQSPCGPAKVVTLPVD